MTSAQAGIVHGDADHVVHEVDRPDKYVIRDKATKAMLIVAASEVPAFEEGLRKAREEGAVQDFLVRWREDAEDAFYRDPSGITA